MLRASSARGAVACALHEVREAELGEHVAVARRREVGRQLRRELRAGFATGVERGR